MGVIISSALIDQFGERERERELRDGEGWRVELDLLVYMHNCLRTVHTLYIIYTTGWMIADPLCSMFIAVLIIVRYIQHYGLCGCKASADVICVLYYVVQYNSSDEGLTGRANAKKPFFP